jgi:hypothetical protein
MPHQIYCDYLEDRGIDTRIIRLIDKPEGITVTNNYCSNGGAGWGYADNLIQGDGHGDSYNNKFGCGLGHWRDYTIVKMIGDGYGCGDRNYEGEGYGFGLGDSWGGNRGSSD